MAEAADYFLGPWRPVYHGLIEAAVVKRGRVRCARCPSSSFKGETIYRIADEPNLYCSVCITAIESERADS